MTWKEGLLQRPALESPRTVGVRCQRRPVSRLTQGRRHQRSESSQLPSSDRFARALIDSPSRPSWQSASAR